MISKDGYKIIAYTATLLIVLVLVSYGLQSIILWLLSAIVGVVFIFHFFFFRDPDRHVMLQPKHIVSPADGKIIKIDTVHEPYYMKSDAVRVCIFMSVFNAHINRNPVNGKVEFLEHENGKFLAAFAENAGDVNEQMRIGIKTSYGKIFFNTIR